MCLSMDADRLSRTVCALLAFVALVVGASTGGGMDSSDFTIAISSSKFAGDMQWTSDRNFQATLDAASDAGTPSSIKIPI
jgi:hypothetical protein